MKHTIVCTEFKPLRRNTLTGFAVIRIEELRLVIRDVAIHEKNSARWAQLPSKPQIDRNGVAIKDHAGRIQYTPILELDTREVREAFSRAVVSAVIAVAPQAFDRSEKTAA